MSTPLVAAAVWTVLWLTPLRNLLEQDMAVHMAVQMPLLVLTGWMVAQTLRAREPCWLADADWLGIPGLTLVVFVTSFWMLPRALDGAVASTSMDIAKFLSLPLLVGLPLGLSWTRMPWLGRAFLWANFIPKLAAIGALYLTAPTRLCAYYRLDQQTFAGWTLIAVATTLGIWWLAIALVGSPLAATRRRPEPVLHRGMSNARQLPP